MNSENDGTDDTNNDILWFETEAAAFIAPRPKAILPAYRSASSSASAAAPSLIAS
jgi:hypothetical protein